MKDIPYLIDDYRYYFIQQALFQSWLIQSYCDDCRIYYSLTTLQLIDPTK